MSTTTSSEERGNDDEKDHGGFETAEETEHPETAYEEHDEPDRKRRRTATEKAREMRIQSQAKTRVKGAGSTRSHGPDSRRRTPSVEPSVARSDDGSRGSPPGQGHIFGSMRMAPARVGKRVRRKPQRWEGERLHRLPRIARREESVRDDESTVSVRTAESVTEPPAVDNPFNDLRIAIAHCSSQPSRRDIVDSFHSWQIRTVSRQAAQQKALHIFLKRRIRKRNARSPEYERMEDDALRSARLIPASMRKEDDDKAGEEDEATEDEVNEGNMVPERLRLPLEAYLPRRVRVRGPVVDPQSIFGLLPDAPHYPGSTVKLDDSGEQKWMTLPTVAASAEWNARKSNTRRRAPASKTEDAAVKPSSSS